MMTSFTILGDIVTFTAGGAFVWFCKDWIMKLVIGGNALSAKLHAKADLLLKK